jgi:hypothetical protein
VEMLPPIETEALVDVDLKLKGTVIFRVIFSVLEIMEVEDASLLVVGKLFLWTLDVSTATVEYTVVTLSRCVDENIGSLINPVLLDDFFVETDISVTISSPVVDGVIEGILLVLFTSTKSEIVIDDKVLSFNALKVSPNDVDVVNVSELLLVVLYPICAELTAVLNVTVFGVFALVLTLGDSEFVTRAEWIFDGVTDSIVFDSVTKLPTEIEKFLFMSIKSFRVKDWVALRVSSIGAENLVDDAVTIVGAVGFRVLFSIKGDVSLIMIGVLYLVLLDVSAVAMISSVITSVNVERDVYPLVNRIGLDDFFVKPDICVTVLLFVTDDAVEGNSLVLLISPSCEIVVDHEIVLFKAVNSGTLGVFTSTIELDGTEVVELSELKFLSVLFVPIHVELANVLVVDVSVTPLIIKDSDLESNEKTRCDGVTDSTELVACIVFS